MWDALGLIEVAVPRGLLTGILIDKGHTPPLNEHQCVMKIGSALSLPVLLVLKCSLSGPLKRNVLFMGSLSYRVDGIVHSAQHDLTGQ